MKKFFLSILFFFSLAGCTFQDVQKEPLVDQLNHNSINKTIDNKIPKVDDTIPLKTNQISNEAY